MRIEITKKAITERFLLICEEVIAAGPCNTKREFATAVGEHPQNLTLMAKGSRAPTIEQIAKACEIFGYSPTWLILNKGPKKLTPGKDDVEERLIALEVEMLRMKETISTGQQLPER